VEAKMNSGNGGGYEDGEFSETCRPTHFYRGLKNGWATRATTPGHPKFAPAYHFETRYTTDRGLVESGNWQLYQRIKKP